MVNPKIRPLVFIPTVILSFPIVCMFLFTYITTPNTYILGQDFSLLSKPEIIKKIDQLFLLPPSLSLKLNDSFLLTVDTASISAQINPASTAAKLLISSPKNKLLFLSPTNYALDISFDQNQITSFIDDLKLKTDKPFISAQIVIDKSGKLSVVQGSLGQTLDVDKFTKDLYSHLSTLDTSPIDIHQNQFGSLPDLTQIDHLLAQAQKLKGKSIQLSISGQQTYLIDDLTLMSWLSFDDSSNIQKIASFVGELNQSLKTDPIDAVFQFENGKVSQFKSSQPGRFVNEPSLIALLSESFNQLVSSAQIDPIQIPFLYVDPIITNQDVNNFGIKELLGRGQSSFSHSSVVRNKNIKRGAEVVNYVLIPPGSTFSFIKSLGQVSAENGYHMAYIIRQGRTELDVGGGICQVSTTLFRAVLNAGLPITERHPHAYRVSYYEEGSRPGFDATVFIPKPDFSFKNDTGHHILIQSFYDDTNKTLTYDIYGTSDGRSVSIENYRQWDYSQPPPDRYIDNPTLSPGQLVQIEKPVPGLKTSFDWIVKKDGQILHQQTFSSNYTPWGAVFRRGPAP